MGYAVGQVLYVVLRKETRVYPMQIVEVITKKTLEGEATNYTVRGGTDPKAQLLLSEVDGEVFDSSEKARTVLIDRVTGSINKIVDAAIEKAKEWYPNSFEAPSDDPIALLKKQPSAKAPAAPQPVPGAASKKRPLAELAAELQQESDKIAGSEEGLVPIGPDGQQARVRSVKLPDGMS